MAVEVVKVAVVGGWALEGCRGSGRCSEDGKSEGGGDGDGCGCGFYDGFSVYVAIVVVVGDYKSHDSNYVQ